jgi:hypothetical protein
MSIGTSILLIAVGAILRFAVSVSTTGFNLQSIGLILMVVGAAGLLLSLVLRGGMGEGTLYRRRRSMTRDAAGGYVEDERIDRGAP